MQCFEIVRDVLEDIYLDIPGSGEQEKDELIKKTMKSMSIAYGQLKRGNSVNHSDVVSRFAYIYMYVTSHANIVNQIIQRSSELGAVFDREKVDVACIGGGPGSELLGTLKYLLTTEKTPHLTCQLFDKEKSWSECWSDVGKKVPSNLRFSTFSEQIDIFNSNHWSSKKKFLRSDIFTMAFFLSEVFWNKSQAEPFFQNLFSNAKHEALFLYIDNNDKERVSRLV